MPNDGAPVLQADQAGPQNPTAAVYWTYEDIGAFFFVLVFLNALIHLSVQLHFLRSSELAVSNLAVQSFILFFLGASLYAILKLRYHQPVMAPLGWLLPSRFYAMISTLSGVAAAAGITCLNHLQGRVIPTIPAKEFLVLGFFLGPMLEESVFRGYLLPVLTRTIGNTASVAATAVLFSAFHGPRDVTHWVWFCATGVAYAWLRLGSQTTTAAALMHATCNLTLFLTSKF